jgi:RHH-type transcriptional regulator, rel operon repressor / antitoxin RelB
METLEKTLNIRISLSLHQSLNLLTKATGRSKSHLATEALGSYLREQSWQIEDIKEGIQEADEWKFASREEVNLVFVKYGN